MLRHTIIVASALLIQFAQTPPANASCAPPQPIDMTLADYATDFMKDAIPTTSEGRCQSLTVGVKTGIDESENKAVLEQLWNMSAAMLATFQFANVDGVDGDEICGHDGYKVVCLAQNNYCSWRSSYFGDVGANSVLYTAPLFNVTWGRQPSYYETIRFPDVNGDGKADVCGRGYDGIYCALSKGSGFHPATLWSNHFSNPHGWASSEAYWGTIRFPDVNGDGKADVCGRGYNGIYCQVSNGQSFGGMSLWSNHFSNPHGWHTHPSYWTTIQYGDVNGDGADDVCGRGSSGMYCALSRAKDSYPAFAFHTPTLWTSQYSNAAGWTSKQYYSTIQLADISGNQLADVCGRGAAGVYCGVSTGSSFRGAEHLDVTAFSNSNGFDEQRHYSNLWVVDANGDQRADVCGRADDGIYCAMGRSWAYGLFHPNDLFEPTIRWVNNFGDNYGWGAHVVEGETICDKYWKSVQPANVMPDLPARPGGGGVEFCGIGYSGIVCSRR